MKHFVAFNLLCTLIILIAGVFLYGHYQDYSLRLPSLEDVRQYEEKIKAHTTLESLRAHYLAHLQRLHETQTPLQAIVEYLVYLWVVVLVVLLVNIAYAAHSLKHSRLE